MNIYSTKTFFEENNVVALKADKDKMRGVNELLKELGNTSTAIPYYAVFAPGMSRPIHFGGNVLTAGQVREVVQQALDAATESSANRQVPRVAEAIAPRDAVNHKTASGVVSVR